MHKRFLLSLAILIFVAMSVALPRQFPTAANLESMGFQMSEVGILTLAMMLAMIMGGIDLSITGTSNLAAIAAGITMHALAGPGEPSSRAIALSLATALAVGAACGAVNGILIGRLKLPAILATLGTLTLYTGLAFGVTKGRAIHGFPETFLFLGIGKILGIPVPLVLFAALAVAVSVALQRTAFGFKLYMIGANPVAARFSAIDGGAAAIWTHLIAGLLSAVAGIITLARTNSANPDYGASYLLMTLLIAILGGVGVNGGSGRVSEVVLALAALQMLSSGLNMLLLRFSGGNFFRDFAWGFLLLFAMMFSRRPTRPGSLRADSPAPFDPKSP